MRGPALPQIFFLEPPRLVAITLGKFFTLTNPGDLVHAHVLVNGWEGSRTGYALQTSNGTCEPKARERDISTPPPPPIL